MPAVIDSHHHFWDLTQGTPFDYRWLDVPKNAAIKRDFLPQHLQPRIQKAGVDRTILVQTQHNLEENRWALRLAEKHDFIAGVVGWVDLASPACEDQLLEFKKHRKFVGVRHVVQDEPDDNFILRPEVLRGLAVLESHNVPFDLLFYVRHLKHTRALAQRFPGLTFILDHLAKPEIKDQRLDNWLDEFRAAARYPNVVCKLSGLVTEADWKHWKPDDLKPYVQEALNTFGPDRLLYGSDWPVCKLAGTYQQVFDALVEALGSIASSDRAAIFGNNAVRVYRIDA
jgi:L-fuconolactonase